MLPKKTKIELDRKRRIPGEKRIEKMRKIPPIAAMVRMLSPIVSEVGRTEYLLLELYIVRKIPT